MMHLSYTFDTVFLPPTIGTRWHSLFAFGISWKNREPSLIAGSRWNSPTTSHSPTLSYGMI